MKERIVDAICRLLGIGGLSEVNRQLREDLGRAECCEVNLVLALDAIASSQPKDFCRKKVAADALKMYREQKGQKP